MLGMVGVTGGVGFLFSAGLLAAGVATPWLRYPIATAGAYAAFLLLMRLWLASRRRDRAWDLDPSGVDLGQFGTGEPDVPVVPFGGGGGFSGGGSSASFGADVDSIDLGAAVEVKSSVLEGALGAAAEADEGAVVLVPVIVVAIAVTLTLGASASIVYNAPVLFAELLLDGAIAAVVFRRVTARPTTHWATGLIRRTWKPVLGIGVVMVLLGIAITLLVPGAASIGDLFR